MICNGSVCQLTINLAFPCSTSQDSPCHFWRCSALRFSLPRGSAIVRFKIAYSRALAKGTMRLLFSNTTIIIIHHVAGSPFVIDLHSSTFVLLLFFATLDDYGIRVLTLVTLLFILMTFKFSMRIRIRATSPLLLALSFALISNALSCTLVLLPHLSRMHALCLLVRIPTCKEDPLQLRCELCPQLRYQMLTSCLINV